MIAFVRGSVVSIGAENLVVDIGPMGVSVSVTPATALAVRRSIRVIDIPIAHGSCVNQHRNGHLKTPPRQDGQC